MQGCVAVIVLDFCTRLIVQEEKLKKEKTKLRFYVACTHFSGLAVAALVSGRSYGTVKAIQMCQIESQKFCF